MWEKIVLNLISNAFKFTFEGEIAVIATRLRRTGVELAVRDTGTRHSREEELPRLFERFHRVEGARGRSQEGTGIGLALVQELVKLHGGSIAVESAVDRGSTFTVTIPWRDGASRTGRIRGAGALPRLRARCGRRSWKRPCAGCRMGTGAVRGEGACPTAPGARPRVLLADDNADMRDYLVRRLLGPTTRWKPWPTAQAALAAARAAPRTWSLPT